MNLLSKTLSACERRIPPIWHRRISHHSSIILSQKSAPPPSRIHPRSDYTNPFPPRQGWFSTVQIRSIHASSSASFPFAFLSFGIAVDRVFFQGVRHGGIQRPAPGTGWVWLFELASGFAFVGNSITLESRCISKIPRGTWLKLSRLMKGTICWL